MPQELSEKEKKFLANAEKNFMRKPVIGYIVIVFFIGIMALEAHTFYQTIDLVHLYKLMFYGFSLMYFVVAIKLHKKYLRIIEKLRD